MYINLPIQVGCKEPAMKLLDTQYLEHKSEPGTEDVFLWFFFFGFEQARLLSKYVAKWLKFNGKI